MPVIGRTLSAWRPDHRLTCHCCTQRTPEIVLHSNGRKATLFDERPYGFTQCPPCPHWVNRAAFAMSVLCPLCSAVRTQVGRCAWYEKGHKADPSTAANTAL